MGLFSKKTPADLGQYHIPIEIVLMNYHDAHLKIIEIFNILAEANCSEHGDTEEAVQSALAEAMETWNMAEAQIPERLEEEAGFVREAAASNGLAKYYDDYVKTRIGMFRFALGYRVMNAMIDFCKDRGIEITPEN